MRNNFDIGVTIAFRTFLRIERFFCRFESLHFRWGRLIDIKSLITSLIHTVTFFDFCPKVSLRKPFFLTFSARHQVVRIDVRNSTAGSGSSCDFDVRIGPGCFKWIIDYNRISFLIGHIDKRLFFGLILYSIRSDEGTNFWLKRFCWRKRRLNTRMHWLSRMQADIIKTLPFQQFNLHPIGTDSWVLLNLTKSPEFFVKLFLNNGILRRRAYEKWLKNLLIRQFWIFKVVWFKILNPDSMGVRRKTSCIFQPALTLSLTKTGFSEFLVLCVANANRKFFSTAALSSSVKRSPTNSWSSKSKTKLWSWIPPWNSLNLSHSCFHNMISEGQWFLIKIGN